MKHYKKSIIGSILALIVGTSCCWLSSLAIWFGGITFIGAFINFIEDIQLQLIMLSLAFAGISVSLFFKRKKDK